MKQGGYIFLVLVLLHSTRVMGQVQWQDGNSVAIGQRHMLSLPFRSEQTLAAILSQLSKSLNAYCGYFERYVKVNDKHYFHASGAPDCTLSLHREGSSAYSGVLSFFQPLEFDPAVQGLWQGIQAVPAWHYCDLRQTCVFLLAETTMAKLADRLAGLSHLGWMQQIRPDGLGSVWSGPDQQRVRLLPIASHKQQVLLHCESCLSKERYESLASILER